LPLLLPLARHGPHAASLGKAKDEQEQRASHEQGEVAFHEQRVPAGQELLCEHCCEVPEGCAGQQGKASIAAGQDRHDRQEVNGTSNDIKAGVLEPGNSSSKQSATTSSSDGSVPTLYRSKQQQASQWRALASNSSSSSSKLQQWCIIAKEHSRKQLAATSMHNQQPPDRNSHNICHPFPHHTPEEVQVVAAQLE
jgi:hypothetical protein